MLELQMRLISKSAVTAVFWASTVLDIAALDPPHQSWQHEADAVKEKHPSIRESTSSGVDHVTVEFVGFDDIIKALPDKYDVQTSWDCIGHQPNSSFIFVCFTTWKNTEKRDPFANQDTLIFRYNIDTKERTFIGSFMEAASRSDNLWKGEIIPKGHTHIVHADGHMWIASQNFHDFKSDVNMTELDRYHGGHFFSIDTDTLQLTDATSKKCPNGVAVDHEGIVAQTYIHELNLLVGLSHPFSNVVLFDYKTRELEKVVDGIPWKMGNPLGREIVALPNGHVYLYRGVEDPHSKYRDTEFPVWMYDHSTGKMAATNTTMSNGFWDSHAYKEDGTGIYIASCLGSLWYLDTATEKWSSLGIFLPQEILDTDTRIASMYTISLSPEEDKLYGIVSFYYSKNDPDASVKTGGDLYVKDLKSGQVSFLQNLGNMWPTVYTGSGVTVGNSIYFARAGTSTNKWIGNVSLAILHLGERHGTFNYV